MIFAPVLFGIAPDPLCITHLIPPLVVKLSVLKSDLNGFSYSF